MRTFFVIFFCVFSAATVHAACDSNMSAFTPSSQLIDNDNGTVTDSKTGLMWKQCVEGLSGSNCGIGSADSFTWQQALQQPGTVNDAGGFAGYTDWRLPNIRELRSIVEEQCSDPAINVTRFPGTSSSDVWSGSPSADGSNNAWCVNFEYGRSDAKNRSSNNYAVRLVRNAKLTLYTLEITNKSIDQKVHYVDSSGKTVSIDILQDETVSLTVAGGSTFEATIFNPNGPSGGLMIDGDLQSGCVPTPGPASITISRNATLMITDC